jgi:hypothetical protein
MLVQRNDNLAIAVTFEVVLFGELGAIMFVVIEFSIYDSVYVFLAVVEWLVT